MDPDKSLIQVVLIRSLHKGQTNNQGGTDAHAHLQKPVSAPCLRTNNDCCLHTSHNCLDMHFMPIIRWVAAGKAVLENTVCPQLSFTTVPMPTQAIQDIINQNACHAILASGEIRFGGQCGIVLQVVPALAFCKSDCCPYHACCRVHVAAATECRQTMLQENSTFRSCLDVMQVSMTDHATSFWFEQQFNGDRSATGVAGPAELPNPHVPPEATFPFFKPGSLSFYV